ncbi:MAG: hypothetical protein CM15mP12_2000 [Gammaproteobacteria bacterium]|nr:MAG: hypothetical protein CM15mP12_2000 [Gammaproteobacteria bacterium]
MHPHEAQNRGTKLMTTISGRRKEATAVVRMKKEREIWL